jgi:hypothetical protein
MLNFSVIFKPFLFIKYSKTTHRKHHIYVIIQNVTKLGIFPIEKYYGAFNRGTPFGKRDW